MISAGLRQAFDALGISIPPSEEGEEDLMKGDGAFSAVLDQEVDPLSPEYESRVSHMSSAGFSIIRMGRGIVLKLSRTVENADGFLLFDDDESGCPLLTSTEADILGSAIASRLARSGMLTAAARVHAWVKTGSGPFRYGALADEYPIRLDQVLEREFSSGRYEAAHAHFCQIILNLCNMQSRARIVHNDLTARNVLCRAAAAAGAGAAVVSFRCERTGRVYSIPTHGADLAIVDFTSAYFGSLPRPRCGAASEVGDALLVSSRSHVGWRDAMTLAASILEILVRTCGREDLERLREWATAEMNEARPSEEEEEGGEDLERLVRVLVRCCSVRDVRTGSRLNVFAMPAPAGGYPGVTLLDMLCSPISSRGLYSITCAQLVREWVCRFSGPNYTHTYASSFEGLLESDDLLVYSSEASPTTDRAVPLRIPSEAVFPAPDIRDVHESNFAWSSLSRDEFCAIKLKR